MVGGAVAVVRRDRREVEPGLHETLSRRPQRRPNEVGHGAAGGVLVFAGSSFSSCDASLPLRVSRWVKAKRCG